MRLYLFILLLCLIPLANADDGVCIFCHKNIDSFMFQSACKDCHDTEDPTHAINRCIGCHRATNVDSYHRLHNNTPCSTCHADAEKPKGITLSACASCHKNTVVNIHLNKTMTPETSLPIIKPALIDTWKKYTVSSIIQFFYNVYSKEIKVI